MRLALALPCAALADAALPVAQRVQLHTAYSLENATLSIHAQALPNGDLYLRYCIAQSNTMQWIQEIHHLDGTLVWSDVYHTSSLSDDTVTILSHWDNEGIILEAYDGPSRQSVWVTAWDWSGTQRWHTEETLIPDNDKWIMYNQGAYLLQVFQWHEREGVVGEVVLRSAAHSASDAEPRTYPLSCKHPWSAIAIPNGLAIVSVDAQNQAILRFFDDQCQQSGEPLVLPFTLT